MLCELVRKNETNEVGFYSYEDKKFYPLNEMLPETRESYKYIDTGITFEELGKKVAESNGIEIKRTKDRMQIILNDIRAEKFKDGLWHYSIFGIYNSGDDDVEINIEDLNTLKSYVEEFL